MGCICTKQQLKYDDPAVPADVTHCEFHFNEAEIEALHELFRKLSSSLTDEGLISKQECRLGIFRNSEKQSLFADSVRCSYLSSKEKGRWVVMVSKLLLPDFLMFDSKNDGVIEFGELVRSLSVFHPGAPQAGKVAFAFQLYDIWETGFIEREEPAVFNKISRKFLKTHVHLVLRDLPGEKVKVLISALLDESDLMLPDDLVENIIDKTFKDVDSNGDGKIDLDEWKEFVTRIPSPLKNIAIPYLK